MDPFYNDTSIALEAILLDVIFFCAEMIQRWLVGVFVNIFQPLCTSYRQARDDTGRVTSYRKRLESFDLLVSSSTWPCEQKVR